MDQTLNDRLQRALAPTADHLKRVCRERARMLDRLKPRTVRTTAETIEAKRVYQTPRFRGGHHDAIY